ncbi:STP1 protein [Plasmodium ovale wallikeri]|uniref:STP1 protein n=1 Tax=Plasmodium ovale wallikeri TaxID=864142 RepID=A0A1A9AFL4_PLAOA|nr:STP1 protein [Plasmodium ovale wallikeri]
MIFYFFYLSKLDCTQYNPPPISNPQIPVEKAPPISRHSLASPTVRQKSQGKDGSSATDGDSESDKKKPHENIPLKPKPSTADSTIHSPIKIEPDDPVKGERTNVKAIGPVPPIKEDDEKKGATMKSEPPTKGPLTARGKDHPQDGTPPPPLKDTSPTPDTQSIPAPTTITSLFSTPNTVINTTSSQTPVTSPSLTITSYSSANSGLPSLPNQHPPPLLPATEGQDNVSHSTPSTSSDTHVITRPTKSVLSTTPVDSSLSQPKDPVLSASPVVTSPEVLGAPASPSVSTITTTVTTTTTALTSDTISTMNTEQPPKSSIIQVPDILRFSEAPPPPPPSGAEITIPAIDPQQKSLLSPTPLANKDTEAKSAPDESPKPEGSIKVPGIQLPVDTNQASIHPPIKSVNITDSSVQKIQHQINQQNNTIAVQQPSKIIVVSSTSDESGSSVNIHNVNTKTSLKDDSKVRSNNNDNPRIISEDIPPLMHIIPTLLYTPFGLLLGRRRKRKKRDLRRTFIIPEKPAYDSPNITVHEWEGPNLGGKTIESDVYIKLLKTNRYKQEMQKRKKENKKTLIEVHMEVLDEYKNDEWELHKGDFLDICLRGFINDENDFYSNFSNSKSILNNIKNEKTIEDIQKQEILWNNWVEDHRNILEQWKKEEWFHMLKNKWRNEEHMYKEKNNKLQENILNEQETYSIVSQKEIWKQWISKQANLIDMFNKEDWFKSMVYAQDKEKDLYHINEYNDISVTSKIGLKNEKSNHEYSRSKDIIQKLMVPIHMMVLEECIKEDIIKHKEFCIDNFIEDIRNQNNYDEKKNMSQSDIDNFKVPEFEEIHTYRNK